jgi:hypothetical protein
LDRTTALEIALRGGVIPALAALVLFVLISWFWPSDVARRYRCGVECALGAFIGFILLDSTKTFAKAPVYAWVWCLVTLIAFLTGLTRIEGTPRDKRWTTVYLFVRIASRVIAALGIIIGLLLLASKTSLAPGQFYEWVLYLAVFGAFLSGLTRAEGVTRGERWTGVYVFAPIAAWMIVPHWPEFVPSWRIQWAGMSLAIMLLTGLLYPLSQLLPGRAFPWWLMLAMATTSVLLFDQSETFGVMAALPTGALAGCAVAAMAAKETPDWRSAVLPFVVFLVGYAYTGAVYPTEPNWLMLLLPFAPLALWICTIGPLARLTGLRAVTLQAACVIVPLVLIAALLQAKANGGAADGW